MIIGEVAAPDLGRPGRPRGEQGLRQVGAAEPEQETELQRRWVVGARRPSRAEHAAAPGAVEESGGTTRPLPSRPRRSLGRLHRVGQGADVRVQVGRGADRRGRIDHAVPAHGEPAGLARPLGEDERPGLEGPPVDDLDLAVLAARGSAMPCSNSAAWP